MKHIECPICSFPNSIQRTVCEFCNASLEEALGNDPEIVPCATCSGTGLVHLDYVETYNEDPQNQSLPCADCGGSGRKALPDERVAAMKKGLPDILETVFGLLELFGK